MTFPIVLAHGVCRFDKVWNDVLDIDNSTDDTRDNIHYFKGIGSLVSDFSSVGGPG